MGKCFYQWRQLNNYSSKFKKQKEARNQLFRVHLLEYQKDKNLPIGQLDIETLKALNIEI